MKRQYALPNELLREMREMRPGQALVLEDEHGREFALIAREDLDHLAEQCGMRSVDAKDDAG